MRAQDNKGLSDSERVQLRGELSAFMSEHPARAPFSVRIVDWTEAGLVGASDFFAAGHARIAASAAVVILLVGGGTSYAAESALPGDALYAVKIGINEKIAATLALSPEAHVHFDAQLADRRLQEAELLAAEGRLSSIDGAQIELHLNAATADFNTHVAALATSSENGAAAAANVQSELEARLSAHAQVLAAISNAVPENGAAMLSLESAVRDHVEKARFARVKLGAELAASSSPASEDAAKASGESAVKAAQLVQSLLPQVAANLGPTTSAAVLKRASDVEESVATGQEHMNTGSYGKAISAFQKAIRTAQKTRAEVNATEQLKSMMSALSLPSVGISFGTSSDTEGSASTSATTSPSDGDGDASD